MPFIITTERIANSVLELITPGSEDGREFHDAAMSALCNLADMRFARMAADVLGDMAFGKHLEAINKLQMLMVMMLAAGYQMGKADAEVGMLEGLIGKGKEN